MNLLTKSLGVAALAVFGSVNAARLQAQPAPPNFDPAQLRQRFIEQIRTQLEVKSDEEWKIIQTRIEKVMQARLEVLMMGAGMFGRGGRGAGFMAALGVQPEPAVEALQSCIEANAGGEVIRARLASLREARKAKEAKLQKAQEELKQLLTVRQECQAVVAGVLD